MSKGKIEIKYAGVYATGATLTEAKTNAVAAADLALNDDYYPFILTFHGLTGFMWNVPQAGWHYTVVRPGQIVRRGSDYCSASCGTRADCEKSMRNHMAQNAMDILPVSEWNLTLDIITDKHAQADHAQYLTWQTCARAWADAGADMDTCRLHADREEWPQA